MSRRLPIFLGVTLAVSWGIWLWMLSRGMRVAPGSTASHLPGLLGPMAGAVVTELATAGRAGLARLGRRIIRRPRRTGLALTAILAPPSVAALAFAALAARGKAIPPVADFLAYPGLPTALASVPGLALVIILNGYGEETGWRGWMLPELAPRLGAFRATLAVAAVWAVWHLPLFWLNASLAALVGPMLVGWLVGLACGAFALSWLWIQTGSVTVLALWHVAYNLAVATPATAGTVAAAVSAAVMLWGAAVAVYWFRRAPCRDGFPT